MKYRKERAAIIARCLEMNRLGINQGTAGNISVRCGDVMLITPSGVAYEDMKPAMIAEIALDAPDGSWTGPRRPSTEWRFHRDIFRARPDVTAIIHTHAIYATVLAMLRRPIPAAHYMIAAFGGPDIRCTDYAPFGTQELSDLAVAGLEGRMGVLLGSHGMIALGEDLPRAMWRAVELETLARMTYLAGIAGQPVVLSDAEIASLIPRFAAYGANASAPESKDRRKARKS